MTGLITVAAALACTPALSPAVEPVRTGADQILEEPSLSWIRGKRVGLITNQTGVNRSMESTVDVLDRHPEVELVALFAPEHGISGQEQAGATVSGEGRLYSLYGETRAPTDAMLEGIDLLIYDIQDVGTRFYTYISTLFLSLQAASRNGIPMVVLDRPNPIDGSRIGGPVLAPEYRSFVGIHPLPIRYGMTPGELAQMFRVETGLESDLRVVPLKGWDRGGWYDSTGLPWIAPSPNMPTLVTASLYPGMCLIEGTNLSEGRGTTRPFELVGAPWLRSRELAQRLNNLGLEGVHFREQSFTPVSSKYAGLSCAGIQVHVLDRDLLEPLTVVLHLLREVRDLHPEELLFQEEFFDRLAGTALVRQQLEQGVSVEAIGKEWESDLARFKERRRRFLLYP